MKKPAIFRHLFTSLPITASVVGIIATAPAFAVTLPTIDTLDSISKKSEVALEVDVNIGAPPAPNNNRPAPNNNQSTPNRPAPNNNRPAPNNNQSTPNRPAPNNNCPAPNA